VSISGARYGKGAGVFARFPKFLWVAFPPPTGFLGATGLFLYLVPILCLSSHAFFFLRRPIFAFLVFRLGKGTARNPDGSFPFFF